MAANMNEPANGDSAFRPDPPHRISFYQVLILFVYHVALALLLAYAAYNVWPPQPWPGDKRPATAANSNQGNAGRASGVNSNTAESLKTAGSVNTNANSGATTNASTGGRTNANSRTVSNTNSAVGANANAGTEANMNAAGAAKTNATAQPTPTGAGDTMGSYGDEFPPPFCLFGRRFQPPLETRLILLVLLVGAIGSYVHAASSFVDYLGNRTLISSWVWWYLLRPFIGMMLALIVYFALRGGFITAGVNPGADPAASFINPFGVAAVAALVGMFSKVATDKLNEVFLTLFRSAPGHGDAGRGDKLNAGLTPVVSAVSPNVGPAAGATPVTITGTSFMEGAKVSFGNVAATAVMVTSPTALKAVTPAHEAGVVDVEVTNTNNQKGVLKGGFTYQ